MKKSIFFLFLGLLLGLVGCGKEAQMEKTVPICLESVSMNQLFASAERVLREMQFEIDKADQDAGQIITRPLRGGQFFEFWRQDNATAAASAESNLHSIQRIAEVRFDRTANAVCANCRVMVRRLSMPDQPIRGRGGTSGIFTESSRSRQSLQISSEVEGEVDWIYLGEDSALEQRILKKMEKDALGGGPL